MIHTLVALNRDAVTQQQQVNQIAAEHEVVSGWSLLDQRPPLGRDQRPQQHTDLAGDALVEFVVNASSIPLRRNQLFVGVLHRDWTALHVIEGDR